MILLLFIFSVFLVLHKKKWAISVFLCTSILIPLYARVVGGITFYVYLSVFIFLYAFLLRKRVKSSSFTNPCFSGRKIRYLISYILIIQVLFVFLAVEMPILKQLDQMKSLVSFSVLFVTWDLVNSQSYKIIYKSLIFTLIIVFLYGIYCYVTISNPYIDYMIKYFGEENDFASKMYRYIAEQRGGIRTRITGVTYNPLQYAILITMVVFITLSSYISNLNNRKILRVLFLLFSLNLIFTGSRGPLIAFILGMGYLFMFNTTVKEKIYVGIGTFCALLIFMQTNIWDEYGSFFNSVFFIWDNSVGADIKGSSVDGRITQLFGVLSIVKGDYQTFLFGKGKGFITDYFEKFGAGTDVLGFESIIFSTLVSHGALGLFFIVFLKYYFMYIINRKYFRQCGFNPKYYVLINSFILVNVITSIVVGGMYELQFLMIYIILIKMAVITKLAEYNPKILSAYKSNLLN